MNAQSLSSLLVLLLLAGVPTRPVQAAPEINLSGFGTLGYAVSDSSESEYRTWTGRDGADDTGSFDVDSRLGVQLDAALNESVSGTLQALSRQEVDGDFAPGIEWAFLRTDLNDSISLRLGRIGVPFYMISDFREVGYANVLLRPPEDSYLLAPLGSIDGLDINGHLDWGQTLVSVQAMGGARKDDFFDNTEISLRDGIGGVVAFERSIARLRFSYFQARISARSNDTDAFSAQLAQAAALVPQLQEPAQDFDGRRKRARFVGLGLEMDLSPWFIAGEYNQRRLQDVYVASYEAWYISAGYRWRNLTPYAAVSQVRQTSKTGVELPPLSQLAELDAVLAATYAAGDQSTIALGLRWDALDSAAFKIQLENISRKSRGASFTRGFEPPIDDPDDVRLLSLAIDFTF